MAWKMKYTTKMFHMMVVCVVVIIIIFYKGFVTTKKCLNFGRSSHILFSLDEDDGWMDIHVQAQWLNMDVCWYNIF